MTKKDLGEALGGIVTAVSMSCVHCSRRPGVGLKHHTESLDWSPALSRSSVSAAPEQQNLLVIIMALQPRKEPRRVFCGWNKPRDPSLKTRFCLYHHPSGGVSFAPTRFPSPPVEGSLSSPPC